MLAHCFLGLRWIPAAQSLENGAMLIERIKRPPRRQARAEPVESHHIVEIAGEQAQQTLVMAGCGDAKMKIPVSARLIIGLSGRNFRLDGMLTEVLLKTGNFLIGNSRCRQTARGSLEGFPNFEKRPQVLKAEIDHARPEMRRPRRQTFGLKAEDCLPCRTTAYAKTQCDIVLANRAARLDVSDNDGLDHTVENLIGECLTGDLLRPHTVNCIHSSCIVNMRLPSIFWPLR
jgi:hypothetical protein